MRVVVYGDRVHRHIEPARAPVAYYNWQCDLGGPPRLSEIERTLRMMREDHVPGDAYVNMSGSMVTAQWQREVEYRDGRLIGILEASDVG